MPNNKKNNFDIQTISEKIGTYEITNWKKIIKLFANGNNKIDILGLGEDFECAMLICQSNKKEFNPYVVKIFYGKTEDIEIDLVELTIFEEILKKEKAQFVSG